MILKAEAWLVVTGTSHLRLQVLGRSLSKSTGLVTLKAKGLASRNRRKPSHALGPGKVTVQKQDWLHSFFFYKNKVYKNGKSRNLMKS